MNKHVKLFNKSQLKFIVNRSFQTIVIVLMFLFLLPSFGQNKAKDDKNWEFTISPYLMIPNMNGEVGLGPLTVDVDASPGDIFENLDFALMLYFEASNEKWVVNLDFLYMDLGAKGETLLLKRETAVDVSQLGLAFNGLYRVTEWASVGAGFRVNSIKQGLKIAAVPGPGPSDDDLFPAVDVSMTQTWVDPLIAARVMTRFNDSDWRLGMVADIGGFGIGSDFTWQIYPFVGYQFSNLFEIDLAYRWLSMDYETGSGTDYFLYDIVISGPELGLLFHF